VNLCDVTMRAMNDFPEKKTHRTELAADFAWHVEAGLSGAVLAVN
jgi:hypothetical protein